MPLAAYFFAYNTTFVDNSVLWRCLISLLIWVIWVVLMIIARISDGCLVLGIDLADRVVVDYKL